MLTLCQPDDFHVHFRDGAVLSQTVPEIARVFGRAVAMPNLVPPVRTTADALAYRARLVAAASAAGQPDFQPLVSLYLTDTTTPDEIMAAKQAGLVAAKLYPAGATTHSDAGVRDPLRLDDVLAAMSDTSLVLQIHGEVTDLDVDPFDREEAFITRVLVPVRNRFPRLRIVFEHITSRAAADWVASSDPTTTAATITPQHLSYDRSAMFAGGLRPHLYCLPVPKTRADTKALLALATSGAPHVFLGSDSAPHAQSRKENACCAAGVYSGPAVLEHYTAIFEAAGALDRLEHFAAHAGADFYRLPRNSRRVALEKRPWTLPTTVPFGETVAVPWRAGDTLAWQVVGVS